MLIRPAEIADARQVAEIHVATWREAYRGIVPDDYLQSLSVERREAFWRASLQQRNSEVWVAEDWNADLAGWISFGACRDADKPASVGEIRAIYVAPAYWSRGVGRALWFAARRRLMELGFKEVTLWCLAGNHRADRFYRAAGFLPTASTTKAAFGSIVLDEIRYETYLSEAG